MLALGASLLAMMACGSDSATGPRTPASAPRRQITVGTNHSCRIVGAATYCWGHGEYGALGNGADTVALTPVLVKGTKSFVTLSAGDYFTCGLTATGAAYCWGANWSGQLGNGDETSMSEMSPVAVKGDLSFVTIAAGEAHSCALTAAGAAYCWGENGSGQLGVGTTTSSAQPVAVSTALRFTRIQAYGAHSCALTAAGEAYCWGDNWLGKLGDSSTTNRLTPVAVAGGQRFVELAGGWDHTCALTAGGETYCWGYNEDGELGIGASDGRDHSVPERVAGTVTLKNLASGGLAYHSCGVTSTGRANCWGWNGYGQLGDGTYNNAPLMLPIAPALTWKEIASGPLHSCGLATDGAAYCWGYGYWGQLGDGSRTDYPTPTRVGVVAPAARVAGLTPALARVSGDGGAERARPPAQQRGRRSRTR
jgi:alpha-tubulin suppressor-like RCC1 family protein